jgi:prefoldin subunit 5
MKKRNLDKQYAELQRQYAELQQQCAELQRLRGTVRLIEEKLAQVSKPNG